MTYEQRNARIAELKAENPNGRLSNSEIKRIVDREELSDRIDSLPDHTDYRLELKSILRDMMRLA